MIPVGLCQCGCGTPTPPAKKNRTRPERLTRKGEPAQFLRGHTSRKRSPRFVPAAGYPRHWAPDHPRALQGYVLEHLLVAERALGRHIDQCHPVHHVNKDRNDNRPTNLVICENEPYHALLHRRARALAMCGNPDWVSCRTCKKWGPRSSMWVHPTKHGVAQHAECSRAYFRTYKRKPKGAQING